jgi:retinol dehydrogenase-12
VEDSSSPRIIINYPFPKKFLLFCVYRTSSIIFDLFTENPTVIGSNCGLGLEAARHFTRLNASIVILACRDAEKGSKAKASIEETTKRIGVVEVWHVDFAAFNSVKAFCKRAQSLERMDILIANAGIATPKFELLEGFESTITVNVISTFLMIMLLVPKMKEMSGRPGCQAKVVVVTSDAHHLFVFFLHKSFISMLTQLQG